MKREKERNCEERERGKQRKDQEEKKTLVKPPISPKLRLTKRLS